MNNMNKYIKIILAVILVCGSVSCNRDEVFQNEQYKNVFALISGTDNVATWVHDLRKPESVGYVSISMGGTNPTKEAVKVILVEDTKLIDAYNLVAFDVNTSKYIQPLASDKYDVTSYELTIPAGEVKASVPVKIRPAGLSPDSAYFIALKVNSYSGLEVNPEKDYLLYRVQTRNWWCSYGGTAYNQRGTRLEVGSTGNPTQVFGSKRLYPLTPTTVRLLAGTELNDNSDINIFNRYSIVLNIGDDNKIQILPYKNLQIRQVDGNDEYPNVVVLEDDGFKTYKTFLLCYEYFTSESRWYTIKEELRLEYKEDKENPRFLPIK
jgi:hypothetical protein